MKKQYSYIKLNSENFIVDVKRTKKKNENLNNEWIEVDFIDGNVEVEILESKIKYYKYDGFNIIKDSNNYLENAQLEKKDNDIKKLNINKIILDVCEKIGLENDDIKLLKELVK